MLTTTTATALALLAVLLTLPIAVILWAAESRPQRIRRWRAAGASQQLIADRLECSRATVRRALGAAF
jgi:DNA invertase Pin-like site-specific DNA recombinase